MKGEEMGRKGYGKTWQAKVSRNVEKKWGGAKVDGAKMGVKEGVGLDVVWCGVVWGGGERRPGGERGSSREEK